CASPPDRWRLAAPHRLSHTGSKLFEALRRPPADCLPPAAPTPAADRLPAAAIPTRARAAFGRLPRGRCPARRAPPAARPVRKTAREAARCASPPAPALRRRTPSTPLETMPDNTPCSRQSAASWTAPAEVR